MLHIDLTASEEVHCYIQMCFQNFSRKVFVFGYNSFILKESSQKT